MKIYIGKDKVLKNLISAMIGELLFVEGNVEMDLGHYELVTEIGVDDDYTYIDSPYYDQPDHGICQMTCTVSGFKEHLGLTAGNEEALEAFMMFYERGLTGDIETVYQPLALYTGIIVGELDQYNIFNSIHFTGPESGAFTIEDICQDGIPILHMLTPEPVEGKVSETNAFIHNCLVSVTIDEIKLIQSITGMVQRRSGDIIH